MGPKRF